MIITHFMLREGRIVEQTVLDTVTLQAAKLQAATAVLRQLRNEVESNIRHVRFGDRFKIAEALEKQEAARPAANVPGTAYSVLLGMPKIAITDSQYEPWSKRTFWMTLSGRFVQANVVLHQDINGRVADLAEGMVTGFVGASRIVPGSQAAANVLSGEYRRSEQDKKEQAETVAQILRSCPCIVAGSLLPDGEDFRVDVTDFSLHFGIAMFLEPQK